MKTTVASLCACAVLLSACGSGDEDSQADVDIESIDGTVPNDAEGLGPPDTGPSHTTAAAPGALHDERGAISALFGLDDALPPGAMALICPEAPGLDGMPVVMGSEIDNSTLDTDDFEVRRASGEIGEITCVTLAPAIDLGEQRTVLLIGQFGSTDDPPVSVQVVEELMSLDGSRDLIGSKVDVTALAEGPSVVLASILTSQEREDSARSEGADTCVADPEMTVLRVAWNGGVSLESGSPITDAELDMYQVTVVNGTGDTSTLTPVGFADLGDSDNLHELCLSTASMPTAVTAGANRLVDPRGDLNPATSVGVSEPTP